MDAPPPSYKGSHYVLRVPLHTHQEPFQRRPGDTITVYPTQDNRAPGIYRHDLTSPDPAAPKNAFILLVWTDGACRNNGQPGARGAWGVSFGGPSPLNTFGLLPHHMDQTSTRAEIEALSKAIEAVESLFSGCDETLSVTHRYIRDRCVGVQFNMDSEYLCKALTVRMRNWMRNDGIGSNGPVAHFKVLRRIHARLLALESRFCGIHVLLVHIERGLNSGADVLAREALRMRYG